MQALLILLTFILSLLALGCKAGTVSSQKEVSSAAPVQPVASVRTQVPQTEDRSSGLPHTIVMDQWWSSDYVAISAEAMCNTDAFENSRSEADCKSKFREYAARREEAQFTTELSTEFQTNPTCSGIALSGFGDPFKGKSFASSNAAHILSGTQSYWSFQVSYVPAHEKQLWAMNISPGLSHYSEGQDNARDIVRKVCAMANGLGGTVTE
jgi:hypothetical protein